MAVILLAVNEQGHRVGEDHQRAKLTNHEVDLIHEMRDQGMSFGQIAMVMDIARATAAKICSGERRSQVIARFKVIRTEP
jgi:hypothetical protein